MATRYYVRMRAIQNLLPLLRAASAPRVVSVLAGGEEGKLVEDDLDLRKPQNYSIVNAATTSGTMGTLTLGKFATENPSISFVHSFPGFVGTTTLAKGSTGLVRILLQWIVVPLVNLFAMSAEEAGARALFYATSERYAAVDGTGIPLPAGVQKASATEKGVYLTGPKSDDAGNKDLLADLEKRGVSNKVWAITEEVFEAASSA